MFRKMRRSKQELIKEECIEILKKEPRGVLSVSFCVMDEGYRKEGEWALNIRSVIVFGRLRIVEEPEKVVEICTNLCKKFTDDKAYVEHELKHSGPAVLCLELEPEHMTGKLVNES